MNDVIERFFGGSPLWVVVRLVILSVVVGIILSALGLSPLELVESIKGLVRKISELGFDAVEIAFGYFLVGAAIVFPIWIVFRLVRMGSDAAKPDKSKSVDPKDTDIGDRR